MPKAPAPPTRIQRSGNGHSYFLDGEKVPGVTTILSDGIPKPALVGWAARTVAEYVTDRLSIKDGVPSMDDLLEDLRRFNETSKYPEKWRAGELNRGVLAKVLARVQYADRDEAANRGTEVHKLAEKLARGEEVTVPDALRGHVESYLRFLEEWDPTDALLERVVINRKWRYMGKLDAIFTFDDPRLPAPTLLDVKTSRSGIFSEVALQLAGYGNGETMLVEGTVDEEPMPAIASYAALHVRADGYDLYPIRVDATTFRTFLYAKSVGEWLDRDHGAGASAVGRPIMHNEQESE